MDLSLERWEGLTPAEREAIARRLAMELPSGFTLHAIGPYRLGQGQHHVALYQRENATFALIPGGAVSLGYDTDRPWEPNPDELESWQGSAKEYGIGKTLKQYIAEATLRVRQVELPPLLIETAARELGWEPVNVDDDEVQEILREYGKQRQVTVSRGGARTRIRKGPEGSVIAERSLSLTQAELAAQLRTTGFRFPTSDEWEYACGSGAPTLFRWGDHVPCDRYPTDVSPAEAARRRQRVLPGGKLERPEEGFGSDWDHHRRLNAFGLFIASDPYKYELVAEIGITRGGDGGCTICGGAGFFVGWLTLATAYFEEHSCKHDPTEPVSPGYTVGRRVLDL
jgi:hypothetical protein